MSEVSHTPELATPETKRSPWYLLGRAEATLELTINAAKSGKPLDQWDIRRMTELLDAIKAAQ